MLNKFKSLAIILIIQIVLFIPMNTSRTFASTQMTDNDMSALETAADSGVSIDKDSLPIITNIEPSTVYNTGGTEILIYGDNFDLSATVTIDGLAIAKNRMSYTKITFIAPAHYIPSNKISSKVDVVVINPNGKSVTNLLTYEYNPPIISNVSPATGTSKSLTFTIYGDYFREGADVYVGESIGNVINLTRKNILCNIRDYEEKIIDIEVVNIDNKSAHKIFARKFLPMIQNITPQVVYLPMLDSVSITITGEHFETGLAVTMAGNIITDLTNTDTTITFNAPLFNGYTKTDITVINPDKTLSTKKDVFEYRDVKANFVISPGTTGKAPYRVLFEDKSDGKISNIKKWIWQYADGKSKISNSKFFAYQYNNIGVYPVTMSVVVLSNGQTYTDTAAVKTINVERPDIDLGFDTIGGHVGYPPFTILLDNQTTYADNLDITWTWDFGNGNTSHEESPEHTYTQTGSYTVTLRAEINDEIKTIQKPNYISVIESKPGSRMTGKISFDNEDKLPDNTWVHVWSPETGEGGSVPVDENGYYTAIDLDPDKEYIISVDFKFGQAYYSDTTVFSDSQAVAVTPADGYNITLPSQFYSVNGKVIFENGQPVSDIMIEAFSKTNGYWTFSISHTRIIEDANYTLNELIPGTYEVNIFSDKYSLKGDSLPITITVNADNPVVKIPDVILMEPTGSISGTISGLATGTNALISAFSPSIDFAQSINIIGTDEDIQYTIINLKPADDYVVKLNASGFPYIYYNSKDKWFEADEVNLINQYHQSNINFTLLFYEGEILGEIIVPCGANMGDIVWIDAYSEALGSNSSTIIRVASDCEDQLGCSYSYMIRGLKRSDDYIVLANSDRYPTVFYDNQPTLNENITLVDISSENPKHIDFNIPITFFLIEGVVLDSQGEGLSNIDIRIFCESTGNFRTNTTDALGNFKILNLNSESGYLIQAIKPNEAPYYYKEGVNHTRDINMATKVYPVSINPGIMAQIIIDNGYRVYGSVQNQHGKGISNIIVAAHSHFQNFNNHSRTDLNGLFNIQGLPGHSTYEISISLDPTKNYTVKKKTITIDQSDVQVNFVLSLGYSLYGNIRNQSSAPVKGSDIFLISSQSGYEAWAKSDIEGNYSFQGLPFASDYVIIVKPENSYLKYVKKNIFVSTDILKNITLSQSAGTISGYVYGKELTPLNNVSIHIYSKTADFQQHNNSTNYKGYYEINGLPAANDYVIVALPNVDSYYWKDARGGHSPGNTVDFHLLEGGAIKGIVKTTAGTALQNVMVNLTLNAMYSFDEWTRTDANGNFEFCGLANSLSISIYPDNNFYQTVAYPTEYGFPVTQKSGINIGEFVDFNLTKGTSTTISGTFTVNEEIPSQDVKVIIYTNNNIRFEQTYVDVNGEFIFSSLDSQETYKLRFLSRDRTINHYAASDGSMTYNIDNAHSFSTGSVVHSFCTPYSASSKETVRDLKTSSPGSVQNIRSTTHETYAYSKIPQIILTWSKPENLTSKPIYYYHVFNKESEYMIDQNIAWDLKTSTTTITVSKDLSKSNGAYYFHIAPMTDDGSFELIGDTITKGPFFVDTKAPTIVSVKAPEKTYSQVITLSLYAEGASEMYISNYGFGISSVWQAYVQSKLMALTEGYGSKDIYVVFKDPAGNTTSAMELNAHATTLYSNIEVLKPVISIYSNEQTFSTPKIWTWHTDKPNCLFRYSIDKNETWEASGVFTAITSATLDKKYGLYYIHIQAKDEDGNQSDIVSDRNIDIDFTLPTIQKLKDDPTPKQSIRWNWSSDKNCLFSFCVDQTGTCEPAEDFNKITTTELKHGDGKWYLHVKAVDLNGNISSKKVWALLDNTPPDITIFQKENDQKTWHWSSGNETNCTFRHTINQNDSWTASGTFNAITSIKFDGYTLCYLYIQAKDQAGNLSDVKSIKISDPLPDEIKVTSKGTGVMLQWPDKTFINKVKSYQIYCSFDSNGPFVKIDPIIIKRDDIDDLIYYGIFDPFTNLDIQQNASYWYAISAQMPDGNFSRLSTPVKGEIQKTDDSLQLISLQQELEGIPGQTVTFNIYVIAGGNFNDSVDLSAAYPSEKPNLVAYEFSETTVIPPALVNLDVNFSFDADPGAYDIEISANGGDRSDSIMLRFSIISQDPQDSFISTHIKQKNVRLGENMDKLGHVSLRMNDKIDIYGSIIPVEENQKINVIIQNEHQQLTETINTNSEGYYELTFQPKDIGNYTVYSQYINSQIQSDVTQFSVRKSNQSKILCETGNQIIDLKEIIKIHLQLNPKLDNIPIHYQITKPDQTKQTNDLKTDVNGECDLNIYLSQAGIWEILTWWEGNDHYEGQLSKPLYLYPGVETPRALIIAGHQENDLLWPAFRYLADRFYQLLINRRLNDDLIYLMSSGYDADDSRIDNNSPTEQAIANYLKSLYPDNSPSKVNDKIPLIIYMVDHGGQKKFLLNTDKYLKADFLDQQLDNLQDETQCEVQVIIDACYSGSFKDALAPSESQKRIIITSTGPKNPSYIDHDGRESFSSHLFNWLFQGYSLGESFSFAKYGIGETPKIYEGQVPDINNIQLANETHLGGTFATSNLMPNIIFHTPNQVLSNPSLTITAEVIDIEDSKCLVWASILPPNHHKPIFGEFNSPQWQLERIDLSPVPGEENIYAGKYDCFYQKGLYVVYLYASDSVGNIDSKEVYLNVTQDHIPQNWGDMDGNRMIDLEDAIIGLQILSGVPHEVSLDCKHRLSLEEILYSLNIMAELN
jgi:PKD repeat protein